MNIMRMVLKNLARSISSDDTTKPPFGVDSSKKIFWSEVPLPCTGCASVASIEEETPSTKEDPNQGDNQDKGVVNPTFDSSDENPKPCSTDKQIHILVHKSKPVEVAIPCEDNIEKKKRCLPKVSIPHFGLLLAVCYGLCFSISNLIAKKLDYHPILLAQFRFMVMLMPTIPFVIASGEHPFPQGKRWKLVIRAVCGCINLTLKFMAIHHIALGDATVIGYTNPVFVAIFARLFLKESCGFFTLVIIVFSLSGVTLVARPPFIFGYGDMPQDDIIGIGCAFAAVMFSAGGVVATRALKGVHFSIVLLTFTVVSIVITSAMVFSLGVFVLPHSLNDCGFLLMLGGFSFLAQFVLTKALQTEQAGPVSICRTSEVVFAFTWQAVFFHVMPHWLSIVGAILVVFAAVMIGLKKVIAGLTEESKVKKVLWFMLK